MIFYFKGEMMPSITTLEECKYGVQLQQAPVLT